MASAIQEDDPTAIDSEDEDVGELVQSVTHSHHLVKPVLCVLDRCAGHDLVLGRNGAEQPDGQAGFRQLLFGFGFGEDLFLDDLRTEEIAIQDLLALGPGASGVGRG